MSEQLQNDYAGYFNSFLTLYRTPDKRLRAAAKLLIHEVEAGIAAIPSRIQLVARWAESNEVLQQRAQELYTLHSRSTTHRDELALSFVSGSLAGLEDDEGLDERIVVRIGKIGDTQLIHSAGRYAGNSLTGKRVLAHHMGLLVRPGVVEIEADVVGEPTFGQADGEPILPVWDGISPIVKEAVFYHRDAREEAHDLVIGTDSVLGIVGRIDELTGQTGLAHQVLAVAK
jgi:hypothetical protein